MTREKPTTRKYQKRAWKIKPKETGLPNRERVFPPEVCYLRLKKEATKLLNEERCYM